MHLFTMRARSTSRVVLSGYAGCGSSVSPHASKGTTNTVLREFPVRRHAVRGFSSVSQALVHGLQSPVFFD